jgi:hypothetical protein
MISKKEFIELIIESLLLRSPQEMNRLGWQKTGKKGMTVKQTYSRLGHVNKLHTLETANE